MCLTEQEIEQEDAMKLAIREDLEYAISHGIVVSNLAYHVAKELGEEEEFCRDIAMAGMLHDIGKLKLCKYLYGRKKDNFVLVKIHLSLQMKITKLLK